MTKLGDRWTPAMKRYNRRVWPLMAAYAVVLAAAIWLFETHPITGPLKYAAAAAPALLLSANLVLLGVYLVEEADEFQRLLMAMAMLVAIGATLSFATVWGFLEGLAGAPHLALWWAYAFFAVVMGAARAVIGWRFS